MELKKTEILEKAAHLIMDSGLQTLTINNLATELNVQETQLYKHLTNDDDILLMLLLAFETDIIEFVKELARKGVTPETELELFFNGLYFLFRQKPYYLSLIFDENLKCRDESIKKSILRIKLVAENYLTGVINNGKKQNTFNIKEPTRLLVNRILSGFRLYMKDEQLLNYMLIELNKLKTKKD